MLAEKSEASNLPYPEALTVEDRADMQLHLISKDDVPELYDVMMNNREHLERHLQTGELTMKGIGESVDWVIENIRNGSYLQYRIVAGEKIIGSATLYDIDRKTGVAKAGIWVEKKSEGKGYANAAMKRLMQYGFENMALRKIVFDIDPDNKRSEQMAERLGAHLASDTLTEKSENGRNFTCRTWEIDKHE